MYAIQNSYRWYSKQGHIDFWFSWTEQCSRTFLWPCCLFSTIPSCFLVSLAVSLSPSLCFTTRCCFLIWKVRFIYSSYYSPETTLFKWPTLNSSRFWATFLCTFSCSSLPFPVLLPFLPAVWSWRGSWGDSKEYWQGGLRILHHRPSKRGWGRWGGRAAEEGPGRGRAAARCTATKIL